MNKFKIAQLFFIIVLLLSSCGGNPDVQVTELSNNSSSYDETVRINNCGGKADSEQTKSRSFATNIEGGINVGVQQVAEGIISAKYSQSRNASVSQRLVAPAGTNMEFVLRWSEEVHAGNVTANGTTGTYKVNIPIAVEQLSSQDLGCGTDISSLTGNWSGTIKSPDGSFSTELNLSFQSSCKMNEICGTYDAYQLPCSGTLTLVGVEGNSFIFLETKTKGENWCGFCYEHIQRLSGNSISYGCSSSGLSKDIQAKGILSSP